MPDKADSGYSRNESASQKKKKASGGDHAI